MQRSIRGQQCKGRSSARGAIFYTLLIAEFAMAQETIIVMNDVMVTLHLCWTFAPLALDQPLHCGPLIDLCAFEVLIFLTFCSVSSSFELFTLDIFVLNGMPY